MKNLPHRPLRGFTLVEILIVIAIIMVLASLGFQGVSLALKKAKTVQSLNIATNLSQAIQSYYDDYGSLPIASPTASPVDINSADGLILLKTVLSQESPVVFNTKGIIYFSAKTAKGRKAGIDYGTGSGTEALGLYDAWGEPFFVAFDHDYNDEIDNPIRFATTEPAIIRGTKAIVYSKGADRVANTKDDVKSF